MLTAPNGRSLTLHNRAGGSADNIVVYGQDITGSFAGVNPNGNWRMSVRDLAGADVGYLNNVSLTLTSR
jgi:subtilisin-like proprotein convertase family protein